MNTFRSYNYINTSNYSLIFTSLFWDLIIPDDSFEPIGVSEVLGEPELRHTQVEVPPIEIEYLQAYEFARDYNTSLTNLSDPVLIQLHPFSLLVYGVSLSLDMSSAEEGMSTPTSAMMVSRVSPPSVSAPRRSAFVALLLTSALVFNPSTPSNIIGKSSGVVTRIPNVPYTSSPFMQNSQSGIIGYTNFVQEFMWN